MVGNSRSLGFVNTLLLSFNFKHFFKINKISFYKTLVPYSSIKFSKFKILFSISHAFLIKLSRFPCHILHSTHPTQLHGRCSVCCIIWCKVEVNFQFATPGVVQLSLIKGIPVIFFFFPRNKPLFWYNLYVYIAVPYFAQKRQWTKESISIISCGPQSDRSKKWTEAFL